MNLYKPQRFRYAPGSPTYDEKIQQELAYNKLMFLLLDEYIIKYTM